jgi:serine/threonine protein kinase
MEIGKNYREGKLWYCCQCLVSLVLLMFHLGRVKIARHSNSGKLAAVKIIPKRNPSHMRPSENNAQEDEERLARSIEREIVIMKLIDHPHILKLYDVWETSNQL